MRRDWTSYFFYRRETIHTTWLLRCAVVASLLGLMTATRSYWIHGIAGSLMCAPETGASAEALILENFDPEYPLFEEAARFQRQGVRRILVPVPASRDGIGPNLVAARITELLADMARLRDVELVPYPEVEPIVWNVAFRMRRFLEAQHIRSVAVVVPAFRSR